MRTIILAGGRGTRLAEETGSRPKPMVEVGGKPILWHIMNTYAAAGHEEFIVALGYLGNVIKEFFAGFHVLANDLTVDLSDGNLSVRRSLQPAVRWRVHLVDTGAATETGGRVKRLDDWLGEDARFLMTYGDAVADLDISDVVAFHESHGKLATVTAVRPPARFGGLTLDGRMVTRFAEKPQASAGWINGGYFVLERRVMDYIDGDATVFEHEPLEWLVRDGQLMAYLHEGFWQPMDTLRERDLLNELWDSGSAPWKR